MHKTTKEQVEATEHCTCAKQHDTILYNTAKFQEL